MKLLLVAAITSVILLSGTAFASVDWEQMYNDLKVKYDNLEDRSQDKTKKIKRMSEKIADQRDTIKELKQKIKNLEETIKDKDEEMKSLQGQSEVVDTSSNVPSAPINLIAISGANQVTLSWDPPSDDGGLAVTHYVVHYKGPGHQFGTIDLALTIPYTVTWLTNGESYEFKVSANNKNGSGDWSDIVTATPNGS